MPKRKGPIPVDEMLRRVKEYNEGQVKGTLFKLADMVRILGLKRETFRSWQRLRYVRPTKRGKKGRGGETLWSWEDLKKWIAFKSLVDQGIKRDAAAQFVDTYPAENIIKQGIKW